MTTYVRHQNPRDEESGFRQIELSADGHKPSWKRFGTGTQKLVVQSHHKSKYLAITAEEYDVEKEFGKTVHVTFDEEYGRQVYEMLHDIYAPKVELSEKCAKLDYAFRTERDRLRKDGDLLVANLLNDVVQNWTAERKARLFDLINCHDTAADALAALERGER